MRCHFLHRLIAVICVLTTSFYGVGGGLLVECKESNGTSHLEFVGCGRDEAGQCVKPCGPQQSNDSESDTQNPCEDKPVKKDVGTSTVKSAPSSIVYDLPLVTLANVVFPNDALPLNVPARWIDVRAAAPPPEMASIRTIVMLV